MTTSSDVINYFMQYGTKISVSKEVSLCNPKLADNYIYYLAEGIASLTSLTSEGSEKDFLYFPAGHLLCFLPSLMRYYRKLRNEALANNALGISQFGIDT